MRIENTDRFRNKVCKVLFKTMKAWELCSAEVTGRIIYIPNYSAKYNFHDVGWFLVNPDNEHEEIKLCFKEIKEIIVL